MHYNQLFFNRNISFICLSGLCSLVLVGSIEQTQLNAALVPPTLATITSFRQLPLSFEVNKGQTANIVRYLSRTDGYILYFTPEEIVLDFRHAALPATHHDTSVNLKNAKPSNDVLRLQFIGANKNPNIVGQKELITKSNYFIGNDPKHWHKDIAHYGKISYQHLYSGIDMIFYGNHHQLEYDIRVAPGASPNQARFQIEGAKSQQLNARGDLVLTMPGGDNLTMQKPVVYQTINGIKHAVEGHFVLSANHQFGFQVGAYDKQHTLIIDPAIVFSTFLGGSGGANAALGVTVKKYKKQSNVYLTGYTNSTDFPTKHSFQNTNKGNGRTAFVTKINSSGTRVIFSTYLGGSGNNDEGFAVAIDKFSNVYVTGETNSTDFPTKNPFQPTNRGAKDFSAFVTKLNHKGNALVYSTYLGGSGENQEGNGIAVDGFGYAYVTGETTSTDFPTKHPFQATNNGPKFTAYVTKLNMLGNDLVWSTYLGGTGGQDEGNGITINDHQDVYITGETNSKDFPTKHPIQAQPKPAGAAQTGYITKIHRDGQSLDFSTYLGGSGGNDYPTAIALDHSKNVYVAGYTNSADFPVVNPFQATNNGQNGRNFNGFITKIDKFGCRIIFSSYLGGSGGDDRVLSLAVDNNKRAHVVGFTNSADFPLHDATQTMKLSPNVTAFITTFNRDGSSLCYSSYLGGSGGDDRAFGVAVDKSANNYIVGATNSSDFPLVNPLQSTKISQTMAFVTKISG